MLSLSPASTVLVYLFSFIILSRAASNDKPPAQSFACSSAFVPLDAEETILFSGTAPELASYCKGPGKGDRYICALKSCVASPACEKCARVTSSATDDKVTTDGTVLAEAQACQLAYYMDGLSSLCLTATVDILQCTGACKGNTQCSTCLVVKEEDTK